MAGSFGKTPYRKKAPYKPLSQIIEESGDGNATTKITALLEEGIRAKVAAEKAERGEKARTNPWASDLGKCEKKVYKSLTNQPKTDPPNEKSQIKFLRGHVAEKALSQIFVAGGAKLVEQVRATIPMGDNETELTVKPDFLLYLDAETALRHGFGKKALLLEIKSTPARQVGSMLRNKQRGRTEHRKQANSYAHAANLGLLMVDGVPFPAVDSYYLVYVLEDPQFGEPPCVAFEIKYAPAKVEADLEETLRVWRLAQAGEEPPIPDGYGPESYPCGGPKGVRYCDYWQACWGHLLRQQDEESA